jgi:predicted nucleic-acid-binding protein
MHNLFGDKDDQIVILDTCVLIDIFADSEGISHYQRYIYQSLLPLVSNKKIFISATTKQELINTMDKNDSITNLLKNKDFIKSDDELIQSATTKFWNNNTTRQ